MQINYKKKYQVLTIRFPTNKQVEFCLKTFKAFFDALIKFTFKF